jgi:lysozyme family protein
MADFLPAFERMIRDEGGYKLVNVAGDRGGQTYAGIARKMNPDWAGMSDDTPRLVKIGDAISQLFNVTFLPRHRETNANESISGRAHRKGWKRTERFINWLFSSWENDHCHY